MRSRIESLLNNMDIDLPEPSDSEFERRALNNGNTLVYISGFISFERGSEKVGREVSIEEGSRLTKLCALNVLANLKVACDADLDRVVQCVKLTVRINAVSNFRSHANLADGASDLLVRVFGVAGKHARSAIGISELPCETAININAIFEIRT